MKNLLIIAIALSLLAGRALVAGDFQDNIAPMIAKSYLVSDGISISTEEADYGLLCVNFLKEGQKLFDIQYRNLPTEASAKREMFKQSVTRSIGSRIPYEIGDEVLGFGSGSLLVRRGNVVFWINSTKGISDPEIKTMAYRIDHFFQTNAATLRKGPFPPPWVIPTNLSK